jgi:hypothetical protein
MEAGTLSWVRVHDFQKKKEKNGGRSPRDYRILRANSSR